jgi:hypothetical protein
MKKAACWAAFKNTKYEIRNIKYEIMRKCDDFVICENISDVSKKRNAIFLTTTNEQSVW